MSWFNDAHHPDREAEDARRYTHNIMPSTRDINRMLGVDDDEYDLPPVRPRTVSIPLPPKAPVGHMWRLRDDGGWDLVPDQVLDADDLCMSCGAPHAFDRSVPEGGVARYCDRCWIAMMNAGY